METKQPEASELKHESVSPPRRFIFASEDMVQFRKSPAKRDLLSFVSALGKSTIGTSYTYDPSSPLQGLSPGMAALYGSLDVIAAEWLKDLPPDENARARFGNPVFKKWHARITSRSYGIIQTMMDCHVKYVVEGDGDTSRIWDLDMLQTCADAGREAARKENENHSDDETGVKSTSMPTPTKQEKVILELQSYLLHSFGHEIRLDFGTGHECSFFVFLFALCKIGIFGNITKTIPPTADMLAPVALSITDKYLQVCRGIQTDYMLEPAGSHGVWGLDDYHCIPFFIGACQMQNSVYEDRGYTPLSINNDQLLNSSEGGAMMYFQCIKYIKNLKKGAPFFESSPMLDDISRLGSWGKVSGGLLRLYEGEVLDKKPVVQHFFFGNIFRASWTASKEPAAPPTRTFVDAHGVTAVAPWATQGAKSSQSIPHTKAPWAK